jgi:hypothetical protein
VSEDDSRSLDGEFLDKNCGVIVGGRADLQNIGLLAHITNVVA